MIRGFVEEQRTRRRMLEAWAAHDRETLRAFHDTVRKHSGPLNGRWVLDLGCGANAPMTLMLHSSGIRVIGVDSYLGHRWGLGFRPSRYLSYARKVGFLRTLRKAAGELLHDRYYYCTLSRLLDVTLTEEGLDLRCMAVESLDFEDGCFDVVHSNATWEHVRDVAAANRELVRILRPGGLAYIEIHLFPSLSGGHDLPWIVPGRIELGGRMPWRHLRDPRWKPPVFLNRLREREYREQFEATAGLEILEWRTEFTEGVELVTEDVLLELPGYTTEELTRRSVIVVLKRIP